MNEHEVVFTCIWVASKILALDESHGKIMIDFCHARLSPCLFKTLMVKLIGRYVLPSSQLLL